jgi:hypothetical protein
MPVERVTFLPDLSLRAHASRDSLNTALAILVLDRLGFPISHRSSVERFFLESQFKDGGWGWSPLYSDGSGTWFGHREITTMFVMRAMMIQEHST